LFREITMELCGGATTHRGTKPSPIAFLLLTSKTRNRQRRMVMKKLMLGLATAAVLLTAVPAMAQVGFFAGPRGVGVQVGGPGYYGGYGAPYNGYYDYYNGPGVVIGGHPGWRGHGRFHGHWR
jgi:hypothetical protein